MPKRSGEEALAVLRERGFDCRVTIATAVTPDFDILGTGFDTY